MMVKKEEVEYCQHGAGEVQISTSLIYPADILPDGPPRIIKRTCGSYMKCNLWDKSACPVGVTRI